MKFLSNQEQNLNEIIFAKKNKSYGAYAIRTSYNNSVVKALGIVCSVIFLFAGTLYVLNLNKEVLLKKLDLPELPVTKIFEVNLLQEKPKTVEKPKSNPPAGNQNNSALGRTITDSVPDNTTKPTTNVNVTAPGTNTAEVTEPFTGTTTGTSTIAIPGTTTSIPTLVLAEEMPEYEGGMAALLRFVGQNINYPPNAREAGIEGTVYVSFVVDENGYVGNVKVEKGIGGGCNEESVRVVSKIPKFKKPGKNQGQAVKIRYNIPIKYKLDK